MTEQTLLKLCRNLLYQYRKGSGDEENCKLLEEIAWEAGVDLSVLKKKANKGTLTLHQTPRTYEPGRQYDGIWVWVPNWEHLVYMEREEDGIEWSAWQIHPASIQEEEGGFYLPAGEFEDRYPDLAACVPEVLHEITEEMGNKKPFSYRILK